MRSAVDRILDWHKSIDSPDLPRKLEKMLDSPFRFFRGTYFLYTQDLDDDFRRPKALDVTGRIIGDLHSENYGTYRSVSGDVVYDINDFDESTGAPFEYDVRRLAISLILGAIENKHRIGDGINAAEAAIRAWLEGLHRWSRTSREEFTKIDAGHAACKLLGRAGIVSRVDFLKTVAEPAPHHSFAIRESKDFPTATEKETRRISEAAPFFFDHCTAPKTAHLSRYKLLHVSRRVAGNGSLGRTRFALLFDNGKSKHPSWEHLRLLEWKESLDSAMDSRRPQCSKHRAESVYGAELAFQLFPKRYLGYTKVGKMEMQGREIGANDARFEHKDFKDLAAFERAAGMFGEILARCHLLGTPRPGARAIPAQVAKRADRYVNSILRFAAFYADQVYSDHDELVRRKDEVQEAWKR
ncbi:MAG: DUF2252 family protein [Acidobacteria bacterium]|nr:DUF2252 family protein [Acidobacteriota bacterium]